MMLRKVVVGNGDNCIQTLTKINKIKSKLIWKILIFYRSVYIFKRFEAEQWENLPIMEQNNSEYSFWISHCLLLYIRH